MADMEDNDEIDAMLTQVGGTGRTLACAQTIKDRRWETAARKRNKLDPRFAYCPIIWTHQDRMRWGAVKKPLDQPYHPGP